MVVPAKKKPQTKPGTKIAIHKTTIGISRISIILIRTSVDEKWANLMDSR